jgi:hypothetical protein
MDMHKPNPATTRGWSILAALGELLVGEHTCVPPDHRTPWKPISEAEVDLYKASAIYMCPECGQHLARLEQTLRTAA